VRYVITISVGETVALVPVIGAVILAVAITADKATLSVIPLDGSPPLPTDWTGALTAGRVARVVPGPTTNKFANGSQVVVAGARGVLSYTVFQSLGMVSDDAAQARAYYALVPVNADQNGTSPLWARATVLAEDQLTPAAAL
jgi:hypothetical protein